MSKKTDLKPDEKTGLYRKAMGGTEMMALGLRERLPQGALDNFQLICSRVGEIDPNKKAILWLHDTYDDPENKHLKDANLRKRFSKFVFVSNYQFQTYHMAYGISYEDSVVLRNSIEPIDWSEEDKKSDKIRLIYHTTPHRGLELLVPVFDHLNKKYPNIHLDVFSSFNAYGWPSRDAPYEPLFEQCRNHPNITYHGYQPNDVVREALKKAHIFSFPSIWPETSCIAAIEAMSAGCLVVHPDFAALPETTSNMSMMYRFQENKQNHVNLFAFVLDNAIKSYMDGGFSYQQMKGVSGRINGIYSWDQRIPQWNELLRSLS